MAFYEGLVSWGTFLWLLSLCANGKIAGAILNMLCMARRVNAMDGIHKVTRPEGETNIEKKSTS